MCLRNYKVINVTKFIDTMFFWAHEGIKKVLVHKIIVSGITKKSLNVNDMPFRPVTVLI